MSKKKLAVVIGRFQPFHNQHLYLVENALEVADKVLVIVGSINQPRTPKNPFTFEERFDMISSALVESGISVDKFSIEGVEDEVDESEWEEEVKSKIIAQDVSSDDVVIIGHSKDKSSYYLKSFPEYDFVEVPVKVELNATDIEIYRLAKEQFVSVLDSVTFDKAKLKRFQLINTPGSFVSAPSEAWCFLQGERPCRARFSQPPVSSVA